MAETHSIGPAGVVVSAGTDAAIPYWLSAALTEDPTNLSYNSTTKRITATGGFVGASVGPSSSQQHTLPAVTSDTVVLIAASQTLTNKTLSGAAFSGANTASMGASQAANTTLWADTINNTQSNSVIAYQINLGTSGKSQGILIKGTGSAPASNTELDKFLTLWGNTNGNTSKVFSIGSDTTYNESWSILARGDMVGTNLANISIGGSCTQAFNSGATGVAARTSYKCSGENLNNNTIANDFSNTQVAVTTAKTDYYGRWDLSRTVQTANSVTDTYALATFLRTNISNHASATLNAQGQVVKVKNVRTQTLGTCTDTVNVLELSQDSGSTGRILSCQVGTTEHHYVSAGGFPGWVAGDTQTTVGSAGGASALPATPTHYLKIDRAGTTFVIPAYAAS